MTKKYILKPGNHQFTPKSHATHHNNNLTDAEAEWYLERYPHIASLFTSVPAQEEKIKGSDKKEIQMKNKAKQNNQVELFTPPLGGRGANE